MADLRIAGIIEESITDGPGIRFVVFAQGCRHNCPGCHNPQTHSFNGGKLMSTDSILEMVKKNPLLDGITLSGGEPFEQAEGFAELSLKAKKLGIHIMTYTGYTYENICKLMDEKPGWKELLENTDILVDGPFELEKRNISLRFRGSENQRIIDVKKSLENNKVTLAEEMQ